jgi:hypothetical protein
MILFSNIRMQWATSSYNRFKFFTRVFYSQQKTKTRNRLFSVTRCRRKHWGRLKSNDLDASKSSKV